MAGEALRSHLDLLLLATLSEAPAHGYAIIDALRARSGGRFDLPEGTVYPALHRLEQLGLLASHWSAETPRPRRVYALTPAGQAALRRRRHDWDTFVSAMAGVLDRPAPGGPPSPAADSGRGRPRAEGQVSHPPAGGHVSRPPADGPVSRPPADGRVGRPPADPAVSGDPAAGERHARP